jgi:hypothetical protein
MVHSDSSEGKKRKPRGRPFTSHNNPSKLKGKILDTQRHNVSDEGGIIALLPKSPHLDTLKEGYDEMEKNLVKAISDNVAVPPEVVAHYAKNLLSPTPSILDNLSASKDVVKEEVSEGEIIDSIEFKKGSNTLKIVFKKQHNRSFRIQIFMNEETEIRPVTYTGSSTASSFWNLLKGSLKKE